MTTALASQEMTLDQWCERLPPHHRVNIELKALREALSAMPTEVATPSTIAGLETALRYLTVGLEAHTAVTEAIRLLRTTVSSLERRLEKP